MKTNNISRYSISSILLLISIYFFLFTASAQNFEWSKGMGSTNYDQGTSIAVDDSGNVYTTGSFQGSVDFDPGVGTFNLTSAGSADIFVSKLDASGNFIWAKRMGGTDGSVGTSISVDDSGNVYTTGFYRGTADFDPGVGTFNFTSVNRSVFVSKLDVSGNFIWAKSMDGAYWDESTSIAVDGSGNVYTTGFFNGTADFNPGAGIYYLTSNGFSDIFISKLDISGNFLWAKSMGGASRDIGYSIVVDSSGNVFTIGEFSNTVDFNPGSGTFNLTSVGYTDIFVSKLDSLGNFLWAKSMGGKNVNQGRSIALDKSGNIYTSGLFMDTTDFDPGTGTFYLTSVGQRSIFVSKLDSTGNFLWAKSMGGLYSNSGNPIAIDDMESVYITGFFSDTADFDPGVGIYNLTSTGNRDIFVSKLDRLGNFLWAKSLGGIGRDEGLSIAADSSGNAYIVGTFHDTVDFDPGVGVYNLSSAGSYDIFISKLVCPSSETDTIIACNAYTWIDSITYNSSTNSPTYTLTNAFGCDSVVTLELTINSNDTTVSVSNDTIMANQQGAVYQWLNCDSSFSVISGATNQKFTPSINGFYACEVTLNGCVDTTSCVQLLVTGIDKRDLSTNYKLYPNPFNDQLIIEAKGIKLTTKIEVLNVNGQLVYEGINDIDGNAVLNTSDWTKGIYFVRLINKNGVGTFKLVHQ